MYKRISSASTPQSQLEIILSTFSTCEVYINPSSHFVFIFLLDLSFKEKAINGRKKVHECSLAFSLQNMHSELFGENSSLSPSIPASQHIQCLLSGILVIHTGYLWHPILAWLSVTNSLLPQHTDHPSHIWNLRQYTIQLVFWISFNTQATRNLFLFPPQSYG